MGAGDVGELLQRARRPARADRASRRACVRCGDRGRVPGRVESGCYTTVSGSHRETVHGLARATTARPRGGQARCRRERRGGSLEAERRARRRAPDSSGVARARTCSSRAAAPRDDCGRLPERQQRTPVAARPGPQLRGDRGARGLHAPDRRAPADSGERALRTAARASHARAAPRAARRVRPTARARAYAAGAPRG